MWFFDSAKFTSEKDYMARKDRQSKRRANVHRDVDQLLLEATRHQTSTTNASEIRDAGDEASVTPRPKDSRDAQLPDNALTLLSLLRNVVIDAIHAIHATGVKCERIQCLKV